VLRVLLDDAPKDRPRLFALAQAGQRNAILQLTVAITLTDVLWLSGESHGRALRG